VYYLYDGWMNYIMCCVMMMEVKSRMVGLGSDGFFG